MRYFDIETYEHLGAWHYIIHDYGNGPDSGYDYEGIWGTGVNYLDDDSAYRSASERLIDAFGKKGLGLLAKTP